MALTQLKFLSEMYVVTVCKSTDRLKYYKADESGMGNGEKWFSIELHNVAYVIRLRDEKIVFSRILFLMV